MWVFGAEYVGENMWTYEKGSNIRVEKTA